MCILCEPRTLELLTAPLAHFAPGQLSEAIRTAREAAGAGILDYAEDVLRGDLPFELNANLYAEIVINRALEAGVLGNPEAACWQAQLRQGNCGALDARVQAFVSSCAEVIDEYRLLYNERQQVVERFVEAHGQPVRFGWLGRDGELWFEFQSDAYAVLSYTEAIEIVQREVSATLHTTDPDTLLRYTALPDTAREVIASIQAKPQDVANSILAELIDLPALADDQIRNSGYAPYFRGELTGAIEDLQFGDWIIIRAALQH